MNKHHKPPAFFLKFFRWYCDQKLLSHIEGDLTEVYQATRRATGKRKADLKFIVDVLLLFRPGIIRSNGKNGNINQYAMYKNYIKIGWRSLARQKMYSFIKISGLALGIAACLLIALYIIDELHYDTYHAKADRIYRLEAEVKFGGNHFHMTYRSAPEAQTLIHNYPEIESAVRFRNSGSYLVKAAEGTESFKEKHVIWADSTFFKIFSVKVLQGDPATALASPASIAISKKIAEKFFPGRSALGQSMTLDNKYTAKVTAVYEDIPLASHFHFDILISMVGEWPVAKEARSASFMSENFNTYLLLKEGADPNALEQKLPTYLEKYMGPEIAKALGYAFTLKKFEASGDKYHLTLRPIKDIHLHGNLRGEFEPNSDITYVYLFGTVAVFILAIACINFMYLSTARSSNRAKEVGVRKVMGSLRSNLIRQFLTESTLITLFSFVLAIGVAYLLLPSFNSLSQKQLEIPFTTPIFYGILAGMCVVIGLIAGLYPAFFLSAFSPVEVLKGHVARGMNSVYIRSTLVVFQFMISIFLIIGAITVNKQLNYIQNKKLGFEKDQVIIVQDAYALRPSNVKAFKDEVLKNSAIESGTISGYVPVENDWVWRSNTSFWREGVPSTTENMVGFQQWRVDQDYIKTFRLHVQQGRGFSSDFPSDSSAVVLNQTGALRLGLGNDPIGKKITSFGDDDNLDQQHTRSWTVIGIVDDFHFSSMKENISALGLFLDGSSDGSVSFRFQPSHATDVVESIEKVWKQLAPGQPFQYSFLDDEFENMYKSEQRLGKIFVLFAGLAIIIACLGLFALTAFTVEQRAKEIGIRLVLGASGKSIYQLLTWNFLKLVLISFIIASPLAYIVIQKWLEDYAYKTEVGWHVFALSGVMGLFIALITISYQAIRTAHMNPARSLRSE
jgi:putative ABC transport system permease protein